MIHFYSMNSCGYCEKAKKVLASEIASGFVIVKDAKEANGAGGFPHFVETTTGATHTGFMADKEKLFEKLGVKQAPVQKEHYAPTQAHANQHRFSQAHAHAHAQAQAQGKKEVENGSSLCGGYLRLSETWTKQKRYVA